MTGRDVQVDSQASAQAAWEVGRSNFFVQGFWWLVHQMGMSDQVDLVLELSGTAEQLLDEADQKEGGVTSARYMVEGEALVVTKGVTGVAIDRGAGPSGHRVGLSGGLFPDAVRPAGGGRQ